MNAFLTNARAWTVCGAECAIWVSDVYKTPAEIRLHHQVARGYNARCVMTNRTFIKTALLTTGLMSVVAAGVALVRVRAQVGSMQPFVAIMVEEVTPRPGQPPTPRTRTQTIAVRSDGSISKVSKWDVRLPTKILYSREVIDATTKAHVWVEDYTNTVVNDQYDDIQVLKHGVACDGKPAGQLQGFDVVYAEHPMGSSQTDVQVIHKTWKAPQLGCYPVVQEWVGNIHGVFNDTKQTLASIKPGEPDLWYFKVPSDYTTRTGDEWRALMTPLLKK